ncbi:unnamed protein product [Oppiella nova]|uniref:Protein-tyrosine-phosphatase n=1 Tax=Oppiella nova TaxID=334625 RepID=A0A7R9M597_9ACAR|nr:unnamed protein product [Oppiella nova]CAG2170504.1 unnamed protein product [Oppiella nova]
MNCWTSSTGRDCSAGNLLCGGTTHSSTSSSAPQPSQSSSSSSSSAITPSKASSSSSRVSTMSRVLDYLYISSARCITYANINKYKITHIINATIEVPIIHLNGIKTIRIPVNDKIDEDIARYFDDVSDFIYDVSNSGGRVLIHCMAGISRSAAFLIAYLMKYLRMSLKDAYNLLHKKRPIVRPNGSFFRQLIDFEWRLFGKNSVKMIYLDHMNIEVPDLFVHEYKKMVLLEAIIARTRHSHHRSYGSKANLIDG